MKNLPEKFPIRYALIIMTDDLIFNQYLALLSKKPLDYSLLIPKYHSASFAILDRDAFEITRIKDNQADGDDENWAESIEDKLREVIPDISLKSHGSGRSSLGMYSYKKSAEIPAFIRVKDGEADYYKQVFAEVQNGKYDTFNLYQEIGSHLKSTKQDLYYSNIWKELDKNKDLDGMISQSFKLEHSDLFKKLPKNKDVKEKITVLICRSWEELFAEEVFTLYKMLNYCNNCGKALPFNYIGRYCPDKPDNIECIRERARKRKHSQYKE